MIGPGPIAVRHGPHLALWLGLCLASAQGLSAPASDSVLTMAERLDAAAIPADGIEGAVVSICDGVQSAADITEALLAAGQEVFLVVRDTILACAASGDPAEIAGAVAMRASFLRGPSARHLINAGVLAAAAELELRSRAQAPVTDTADQQAARDLDRERLERMMQKGLLDDEYRKYIDERRSLAPPVAPEVVDPFPFWPLLPGIYIPTGPGGSASVQ